MNMNHKAERLSKLCFLVGLVSVVLCCLSGISALRVCKCYDVVTFQPKSEFTSVV